MYTLLMIDIYYQQWLADHTAADLGKFGPPLTFAGFEKAITDYWYGLMDDGINFHSLSDPEVLAEYGYLDCWSYDDLCAIFKHFNPDAPL